MSQAKRYFVDSKRTYEAKDEGKEQDYARSSDGSQMPGGNQAPDGKQIADGTANGKSPIPENLVDKVIEGVKRNMSQGYSAASNSPQDYKAPIPEKVVAGADDDLDGLVNSPAGGIRGKKAAGGAGSNANPMKSSSNPLEYVAGEILQNVRDSMVKNPLDSTYQVARKACSKIVKTPESGLDIILHEVAILGIYAFLDSFFSKKQ